MSKQRELVWIVLLSCAAAVICFAAVLMAMK